MNPIQFNELLLMSTPYVFYIRGMTCAGCSGIIEHALSEIYATHLQLFQADVTSPDPKKTIIVLDYQEAKDHKKIWESIKAQIEELGYNCEPYEFIPIDEQDPSQLTQAPGLPLQKPSRFRKFINWSLSQITSHWFQGALGCIIGISLLITMLVTGGLPLAALIPLAVISLFLTLALGANSYYEAWKKWAHAQTLTMDTLFAISTLVVLGVSIGAFFVPWLPMMFEVGLLIYGFRHIGIAIEETIKEKISSSKFQDRAPKLVNLLLKNTLIKTPLFQIKPGDTLMINPGEIIPVDGVCLEETRLYNTISKGSFLPRHFNSGSKVLAGMRVADNASPLPINVTKTFKESYLARLDADIAQSIIKKTPLEIKTKRILAYFIPTVLLLAITSGILISIFFPPALAIQCAISVLVSACPCTLGLIIPLAVKTGVYKAAENGVRFKKSQIQDPEQVEVIVFDLNGTLTEGVPIVKQYSSLADTGISPHQFLDICCSLEKDSVHPIGKAIHTYAQKNSMPKNTPSTLDNSHHSGVTGTIDGINYTIGSATLMHEKGIDTAPFEEQTDLEEGDSLIFLARENGLIGYIILTDPLRKDAKQAIDALKKMGKEIIICTGTDEKTAARYANSLGIKTIHANCTGSPQEEGAQSKPMIINSLKAQGRKVAMVGDAGNDAHALASSDFGIAVLSNNSDELTQKHAGAIIQNDSLLSIVSIFAISQQTVANINQNLLLSFSYNLISILLAGGLLLAIGITLPPALGVLFMVVQACSVLYNVYRFKNQPLDHLSEGTENSQEFLEVETSSPQLINQHLPRHTLLPQKKLGSSLIVEETAPQNTKSPFPVIEDRPEASIQTISMHI